MRLIQVVPLWNSQSHELIDDACTWTRTSSSFGTGFGTSASCNRSGDPYLLNTIAFVILPTSALGRARQRREAHVRPADRVSSRLRRQVPHTAHSAIGGNTSQKSPSLGRFQPGAPRAATAAARFTTGQ